MEHQYDEIKSVYMDMRGWRHDYHNHMQVMKAQLTLATSSTPFHSLRLSRFFPSRSRNTSMIPPWEALNRAYLNYYKK